MQGPLHSHPHVPRTFLIADHRGAGLAERLRPLSGAGLELVFCSSVGETRAALLRGDVSLVVLDPLAPGGVTEIELAARGAGAAPRPVLVLVDAEDLEVAAAAGSASAGQPLDLARRDAPLAELRLRMERLLAHAAERRELERVRYEAHHDDRTGLLRPSPFEQRLREHFSAAQRHGLTLALVLVDLDRFGAINKEFDHTVGDSVISRAGEVIRRSLRAEDVGGRLGGDEFAVVLPYTRAEDAARVVQRLLDELHRLSGPGPVAGSTLRVSASVGFETYSAGDVESVEALRRRAESALREAKRRGGNAAVYHRSIAASAGAPMRDATPPRLVSPEDS